MTRKDTSPGQPHVLGPATDHYWLVQRMAKATGVDIVHASNAGLMNQDEWAEVVTTCRACVWAEGCARWLDLQEDAIQPTPETCLNRQKMQAMRRALETLE